MSVQTGCCSAGDLLARRDEKGSALEGRGEREQGSVSQSHKQLLSGLQGGTGDAREVSAEPHSLLRVGKRLVGHKGGCFEVLK